MKFPSPTAWTTLTLSLLLVAALLPACGDGPGTAGGEICGDGIDNDNDGAIDEGIDNDNDGWTDTDDPDCVTATAEAGATGVAQCNDGIDNDGDGLIDEEQSDLDADGLCDGLDTEDCDGVDNDGDGLSAEGFAAGDGVPRTFSPSHETVSTASPGY